MASTLRQCYDLPEGATLTIAWEGQRPITEAELLLLARLARDVEGSQVMRTAPGG